MVQHIIINIYYEFSAIASVLVFQASQKGRPKKKD